MSGKSALAGAAVAALFSFSSASPSKAADLPVYIPPPEPVWSWTGPYAGLHVGTIDGDIDDRLGFETGLSGFDIGVLAAGGGVAESMDPDGIMGGLQAGYNFQFDSIVLGIEGDVSFGDVDDVLYPTFSTFLFGLPVPTRMEAEMEWMATIRGRLGWAWDRTLFYVTGGAAFTELQISADGGFEAIIPFVAGVAGDLDDKDRNTMIGWTVGGGVEHALTDHISFKAEYLYADFGKKNYRLEGEGAACIIVFCAPLDVELAGKVKLETHTFRVGVNWLF